MNKTFFTSDLHLGHANIIKYESRPYANVNEMDKSLIHNWNSVVGDKDEVYILGDVSFHKDNDRTVQILRTLKGKKYLILGNHDKNVLRSREIKECFEWVKDYYKLSIGNTTLILFHYPIQVWDCKHHGAIHLYGHVHSNISGHSIEIDIPNSYNVGVDVNGYVPISFEQIMEKVGVKNE